MKHILFIIILLNSFIAVSQNEAANWYFGQNAGINFNINTGNVTTLISGQLNTREGCASISDSNGNLLFYTDGITVWDKNHTIMQNGTGLFGDPSSTQSALIVPKPNDQTTYYIFTVDTSVGNGDPDFGFNYSIVDITLNGGLGVVTTKNINLLQSCSEKVSAVLKDCMTKSIWVITYASQNGNSTLFNTFHAFEITDLGVNTSAITSTFSTVINDPRGSLKLSPDGLKLANANMSGGLFLYDFDVATGFVSNEQQLFINSSNSSSYGVEFSPNNQFLYVHSSNDQQGASNHFSSLTQFDITAINIEASEIEIDNRPLYRGGLQLGPDGKIYRALSSSYSVGQPFLGVIHSPNEIGLACNYQHNAISLSQNSSSQGLPPFIQSFFNEKIDIIQNGVNTTFLSLCNGELYTLMADNIPDATYTWTLNGNLLTENDFDLEINQNGNYEVLIELNTGDCIFLEGQAIVEFFDIPMVANQPVNMNVCSNTTMAAFDFTTKDIEILGTQDPLVYNVHYYPTQTDADDNTNEIIGNFTNTANPQEIFVKIDNMGNSNCFDSTSFFIEVFVTPEIISLNDVEICDEDLANNLDGIAIFDLTSLNAGVLGIQDGNLYNISYHSLQIDADSGSNPLPDFYTNTTPNLETIFIRIENNAKTDCYSTSSFQYIVNSAPLAIDTTLIQCDEDGITDGFTTFNLNQAFDEITANQSDVSADYYLYMSDLQSNTNQLDPNSFDNFSNPQTIYVEVTNDIGCKNTAMLTLEVATTSTNNTVLKTCDTDGVEDGFYAFDLSQASQSILISLPSTLDLSFYETYNDALIEQNPLSTTFTNTIAYSQIIYARVENSNACYGISEVLLTVLELPNLDRQFETIYCLNSFPETIIIDGGIIDDSPSNYYYSWSTGENTSQIEVNEPGTYTVRVTNTESCFKDRTITVLPSNIATITNIEVTDATENNSIAVFVTGEGNYEYAINNINGPYNDINVFENMSTGIYTIYVRDKNNCGIVDEMVSVIGFPKIFTPNNDSFNDTWQIQGVSEQFQPNTSIFIFDRNGRLLKELDPLGTGWDGTYNGHNLPPNDYWFSITLQDGRVFKNHFSLKR